MPNPYLAEFQIVPTGSVRIDGEITFTDPANQPGGGGGGSVDSVTAGDASITIGGTAVDPTVAVAALGITAAKIANAVITLGKLAFTPVVQGDAAGGSLAGTFPNPSIAANAVTNTEILNNTIQAVKLAFTPIASGDAAGGSLTGTFPNPTVAALAITNAMIANATIQAVKLAFTPIASGDAAGGDLSGTYPNPTTAKLNGVAITNAPSAGTVLAATDATHAAWGAASGGGLTLLFDQTLSVAAATIDTGAGGIAGGHGVIEVWMMIRTADANELSVAQVTVNADTGSNYDQQAMIGFNATASANFGNGTNWGFEVPGGTDQAGAVGVTRLTIPGYDQTTFHKQAEMTSGAPDPTAANNRVRLSSLRWKNTAAITRLTVTGAFGNIAAGSRLLIYGTP